MSALIKSEQPDGAQVGATLADVKLGDLGAARNVKSTAEYTYISTSDHMPARWLPLEAIRDAEYSHKSDVFSFGVLMWEICTLGKPPWGTFGITDSMEGKNARIGSACTRRTPPATWGVFWNSTCPCR